MQWVSVKDFSVLSLHVSQALVSSNSPKLACVGQLETPNYCKV